MSVTTIALNALIPSSSIIFFARCFLGLGSGVVRFLKSASSSLRGLSVSFNRGFVRCMIAVRLTREQAQSIKNIFFIVMSRMSCFSLFCLGNPNICMRDSNSPTGYE